MEQFNQTQQNLDTNILLHHASSTDMSQDLDPSHFYLANDPRHNHQPLFPRQHSHNIQATISPSKSVETISSTGEDASKPVEKHYHYLSGDGPESPRSLTMPNLLDQSQSHSNTLPMAIYPPYPPQPHPRTFTPIENRNNITSANTSLGHSLLPFANSANIKPRFLQEPLDYIRGQTFSSFLEEKQYETVGEKGESKDGPSDLVNFPPSKPELTEKKMKIGDDDTIVRQITVKKKKKKNYPTKYIFVLYQIFLIILLLAVAAVAVIALLEVKRFEGSVAAVGENPTPTTRGIPTTTAAPSNTTNSSNRTNNTNSTTVDRELMEIQALISNMNATILELTTQVSLLTTQLANSNTTLNERVVGVEATGTQLGNQIQSLNTSLIQSANESIGPCIRTNFLCRSHTGGLGCSPNGNSANLRILEGYQVAAVWCEGSLFNSTLSTDLLSGMATYVKFFQESTPQVYECGCNLDRPQGLTEEIIFECTTNLIQCRI